MSEQVTPEVQGASEEPVTPEVEAVASGEPAEQPLGAGGVKALKAERDRADAAEKRLKELENANLTELQKAQLEATENREAAVKAVTEAHRWRAAAKFGLSDEDAETFLTGNDEETILRQAETYSKRISDARGESAPGPRPDLSQSSVRDPAAKASPADDFAAFLTSQLG